MTEEIEDLQFYSEEEFLNLSKDVRLAQKRNNKTMQITRINFALAAILQQMGFESDKEIDAAEKLGEMHQSTIYDAYLVAKYELAGARKRLSQMPKLDKRVDIILMFWDVVKNEDPEFFREMRAKAGKLAVEMNARFIKELGES